MTPTSAVVATLGTPVVSGAWRWSTRRRLRALAYHDVPDAARFAEHLDHLARHYVTVTGAQVADSIDRGVPLPAHALWITFDDGDASVVRSALPLLRDRGMVATAFLCADWIDSDAVPWWVVVRMAAEHGLTDGPTTTKRLKRVPDTERRAEVEQLIGDLAAVEEAPPHQQWSSDDVRAWLAAGNDIGNHSLDHPCLDQCAPEEQRRQVNGAHRHLSALVGGPITTFAWPNGNAAPHAAAELRELGYRVVAGFEHRLAPRFLGSAVPRLRIDADAPIARLRAIESGAHPAVFAVTRRDSGGVRG